MIKKFYYWCRWISWFNDMHYLVEEGYQVTAVDILKYDKILNHLFFLKISNF